jgi:hypothetical protein
MKYSLLQKISSVVLVAVVLWQAYHFANNTGRYNLALARDMVTILLDRGVSDFFRPVAHKEPEYAFAQAVNQALPLDARVLYINDNYGEAGLDRYFRIRYWMFSRKSFFTFHEFKNLSDEQFKETLSRDAITHIVAFEQPTLFKKADPKTDWQSGIISVDQSKLASSGYLKIVYPY